MECCVSPGIAQTLQCDREQEAEDALVLSVLILCAKPR